MRASSPIDLARRQSVGAVALGCLVGCASGPDATARAALAPTGTLRIAVYPGSPSSLVRLPGSTEERGLSVDIGRELARRLGVPAQLVVYPRVAEVVAALQRGEADVTLTNASAERLKLLDFTPPLLALELGVLVREGSPLKSIDDLDTAGLRIGVSQGSSSDRAMRSRLQHATLITMPTLDAARDALAAAQLDAFATNKAILFELNDRLAGARVLDGRWGLEHLALATGQGRSAGLDFLRRFAADLQSDGLVQRAALRAGMRGTAAPDAR
jgi:polar amino acid transport system substrate-binding protein